MLKDAKIYNDGSHFIAIPQTSAPYRRRKSKPPEEIITVPTETNPTTDILEENHSVRTTKTELFNELYEKSKSMSKSKQKEFIEKEMKPYFKSKEKLKEFVDKKEQTKQKNDIVRRVRFIRKFNMNEFNFFVTFTYDGKLHTPESFKKSLRITLNNLHTRKGWTYMGVWEHSPKGRIHFHGFLNVPDGAMVGEMITKNDYSFDDHKRQNSVQNTYFNARFGRSDFVALTDTQKRNGTLQKYLLKYITKSNDRIVYSRGLPTYVRSDVMDADLLCEMTNQYGTKFVLPDNFTCIEDGEILGEMSVETKAKMKTAT